MTTDFKYNFTSATHLPIIILVFYWSCVKNKVLLGPTYKDFYHLHYRRASTHQYVAAEIEGELPCGKMWFFEAAGYFLKNFKL